MTEKENIKIFVQQTLGCGCPEEVFYYIDRQSNVQLDGIVVSSRINIGNRLLIYVVETKDADFIAENLPFLIKSGRKERDSLGFNRFRLVLAADNINEMRKAAEELFALIDKDEKVHLHIVPRESIPFS